MTIQLKGRTSHAAHPEDGLSPAEAMCKLIIRPAKNYLKSLPDFSPGHHHSHAQLGEVAFGTTPGNGRGNGHLKNL